jgi:serine protease Do
MIGNLKPGTRSTLTVFRRGATRELAVTIGEFEPEKPVARREREREEKPRTAAASALGLTVTDLTDAQKRDLKLKGGVRVEAAVEAAARAGLREGDVILALANVEVGNLREFETQLAKLEKGRPVNVLFRRGEWAQYAVIRPPR